MSATQRRLAQKRLSELHRNVKDWIEIASKYANGIEIGAVVEPGRGESSVELVTYSAKNREHGIALARIGAELMTTITAFHGIAELTFLFAQDAHVECTE